MRRRLASACSRASLSTPFGADIEAGLTQELVHEQAAAHADAAVDAPDGEFDALCLDVAAGELTMAAEVGQRKSDAATNITLCRAEGNRSTMSSFLMRRHALGPPRKTRSRSSR